jgi:hypothetical protein
MQIKSMDPQVEEIVELGLRKNFTLSVWILFGSTCPPHVRISH